MALDLLQVRTGCYRCIDGTLEVPGCTQFWRRRDAVDHSSSVWFFWGATLSQGVRFCSDLWGVYVSAVTGSDDKRQPGQSKTISGGKKGEFFFGPVGGVSCRCDPRPGQKKTSARSGKDPHPLPSRKAGPFVCPYDAQKRSCPLGRRFRLCAPLEVKLTATRWNQ